MEFSLPHQTGSTTDCFNLARSRSWIGIKVCILDWVGQFQQYFIGWCRGLNMADKRLKFYPPKGGEPVIANPEYRDHYLSMGWTEQPKAKEKPKDGKTDRKIK